MLVGGAEAKWSKALLLREIRTEKIHPPTPSPFWALKKLMLADKKKLLSLASKTEGNIQDNFLQTFLARIIVPQFDLIISF